jgi:hypothetical protein
LRKPDIVSWSHAGDSVVCILRIEMCGWDRGLQESRRRPKGGKRREHDAHHPTHPGESYMIRCWRPIKLYAALPRRRETPIGVPTTHLPEPAYAPTCPVSPKSRPCNHNTRAVLAMSASELVSTHHFDAKLLSTTTQENPPLLELAGAGTPVPPRQSEAVGWSLHCLASPQP